MVAFFKGQNALEPSDLKITIKKTYFQQLMTVFCNSLIFTTTFKDKSRQKLFLSQIQTGEVVYYDVIVFEK